MAGKTELAETILGEASGLFRRQGYAATSIKQIAKAAGCTTAALYYYYEGGKSEILHEVIQTYRHQDDILDAVRGAGSLEEYLTRLATALSRSLPAVADQINWLMLQFPTLPEEEKQVLQGRLLFIQESIRGEIGRFVSEGAQADRLAWLVFSAFFGFFQLSIKMELGDSADLNLESFGDFLIQVIGGGLNR
jgi:AcrR family transcriptional regulator